eukprot:scaffold367_cov146-Skeletonema_menzelii.AAC.3
MYKIVLALAAIASASAFAPAPRYVIIMCRLLKKFVLEVVDYYWGSSSSHFAESEIKCASRREVPMSWCVQMIELVQCQTVIIALVDSFLDGGRSTNCQKEKGATGRISIDVINIVAQSWACLLDKL